MPKLIDAQHAQAAAAVRAKLAIYEEHRDLIVLGAYQTGRDRAVDEAVAAYPQIDAHLRQSASEVADWDRSIASLLAIR